METRTTVQPEQPIIRASVAILNWNGYELLQRFLPSVVACTPCYAEVVVIDNGSTDDSLQLLASQFPTVRVVTLDQNYGFAEGYNRGIVELETTYVVLLNSDVEVTQGWLDPLVNYCDAHPVVAACQPKLLAYNQRTHFEYAGASGGYIDRYGYPFCRGRIFDTVEEDKGQYNDVQPVFWATGAALFVRREVYNEVGGLDNSFFAHMEEIDLCWRIHLAGHEIVVVPQSEVYHLGGATLAAGNPRKTYLNFRNNLLMLHKNLPRKAATSVLLLRMLLDGVAWVKFVVSRQWGDAGAVWRAHRDFRKMRRNYPQPATENMLATFPEGRQCIVFDYYLRGRKRYK